MPTIPTNSGLRDNHTRGTVADFLKGKIQDGSRLSVVSAYFTIYAYDALKDIREDGAVLAAVAKAVETFGGIDILVNNASAISLTDTEHTPMKRYDPMNGINARGTYLGTQACLP